MEQATLDRLKAIVGEMCELPTDCDIQADLYRSYGLTSFRAMDLLMAIEEQFEVTVPDEEFTKATTLQALAEMVERLKSGGQ